MSGCTCASQKNVCAAPHIEIAGAAVLKAIRLTEWPFLNETRKLSTAIETVAAAGPNSSADEMKNVSEDTEIVAAADSLLMLKSPVSTARAVKSIQAKGCGNRTTAAPDQKRTAHPTATVA